MGVWFRHADRRYPFAWESDAQPGARWHGEGEGPVQYLADTPDGAWAEFLRHEEITDPADLPGIARSLWAIEVNERAERPAEPDLPLPILTGALHTYPRCQREARRLRAAGARALRAPSAALRRGGARGQRSDGGLVAGEPRDGRVLALFGLRPALPGWRCVAEGAPEARLLPLVRPLRRR